MNRKRLILAAALIAAFACLAWSAATEKAKLPTLLARDFSKAKPRPVVRVIDGDTFVIERDGKKHTVRLIGVDTPETVHPRKPVEAYGKEASRFLTNLLKGEKVYLFLDKQQGERDRYGRLLAYAYRAPDGLFVNAEIIRQGYGHAYVKFPFKYMAQFRQLERFAREAQKGLWAPAAKATAAPRPKPPVKPVPAPVVKPKPAPAPGPGDVTVYVTRTGKKYHRAGCRYLRRSRRPIKLKDAKAAGYGPCSVCGPPG